MRWVLVQFHSRCVPETGIIQLQPRQTFRFQMFPENVLKIIRKFADDVVISLQYSLEKVPKNLIYVKMKREWLRLEIPVAENVRMVENPFIFHHFSRETNE